MSSESEANSPMQAEGDQILQLRTNAWYGDTVINLTTPSNWQLNILNPQTPPPLSDNQIAEAMQNLQGQGSISKLCRGKLRPLIIVDDLTRPTPAHKIIPILLSYFREAGVKAKDINILMATGAHGPPANNAMLKKVGEEAARSCRLHIHDCFKAVKVGKTSHGTVIYTDPIIPRSDFLIGIGGIYPNNTTGFGGGTKLALGTLGIKTIFNLHSNHENIGQGNSETSTFRDEINEVADMIGLHTTTSLQINGKREIIRVDIGDPLKYYTRACDFAYKTFSTPACGDADVILSNTYPCDGSLTFAAFKGFTPFHACKPSASKLAIAPCNEGIGLHNLFPFIGSQKRYTPKFYRQRQVMQLLKKNGVSKFSKLAYTHLRKKRVPSSNNDAAKQIGTKVWLYRPGKQEHALPSNLHGIEWTSNWATIVKSIEQEQHNQNNLTISVYPCAFLQIINS